MNLNIYQLSRVLSTQKVLALGLFRDSKVDSMTKYLFLFENIVNGKIKNDEEAKRALNYAQNSKSFVKFKERYTKKVLDYIILSDAHIEINENLYEEHIRLLKLFVAGRFLLYHHQNANGVKIFIHIYKQSKKLELFDLQLFAGLELRTNYAFINPDKKKYVYYDKELEKIQKDLNKNLNLSKFYDQLSHESKSSKEENVEEYKKMVLHKSKSFLESIEESDSLTYKNQVHQIAAFTFTLNNQLEESIKISKESVSLFEQSEHIPRYNLYVAYKDIMSTYLKLKDIENAKIYLDKTLSMFTKKHYNYFRMKSLEYTIYAYSKDYFSLFTTTARVLSSKPLYTFKNAVQEWKLREAFANILLESGQIEMDQIKHVKYKKFKLSKFINEVDTFSKDKRGTNISILVVELMHFLIRKQYNKLHERLEALNAYTYRYLRKDETLRSNCFIKMLLKIPEAEYHPLRTIRYVTKYEKKLRETPFEISLKAVDVEIIPYEHLWDIILEILKDNLKKKKH
ncbi:MAG: hypothetical protein P1U56_17820 [Saprospiraceae bacterium]|nr:hypothetical protein [Saprospiraceae bacterium]